MKSFFEQLSAVIPASEMADKAGLTYLSAGTAVTLADRPEIKFVDFGDKPFLEFLGGALVAVDLTVEGHEAPQRMYLPVMDNSHGTIPLTSMNVADVNNSRQRCLVKALATVYGAGMSLFLNCEGDGPKAVKILGVETQSDLAEAKAVVANLSAGGEAYIEWSVGVAVCRITDPTFFWKVLDWDGKPYREVLGGMFVDVLTIYKGKQQVLSLPVLDGAFEPIPMDKVSPFDWNKTVMRALTKCISFNTGYGLSVYAEIAGVTSPAKDAKNDKKVSAPAATSAASKDAVNAAATAEAAAKAAKAEAAKAEADVAKADAAKAAAATAAAKATAAEAAAQAAAAAAAAAEAAAQAAAAAVPGAADAPADAPVVDEAEVATVNRFRAVMRARNESHGVPGLMSLFEALKLSTKYDEAHKPACSSVLVNALASQAEGQNSIDLVENLAMYGSMANVPADSRDVLAGRIVANLLAATLAIGDEAVGAAPAKLIAAGVVNDIADLYRVANLASVPVETLDLVGLLQETATA